MAPVQAQRALRLVEKNQARFLEGWSRLHE